MGISCPTCARTYPDGASVCPADGTSLLGDWNEPTTIRRTEDIVAPKPADAGDEPKTLSGTTVGDYVFGPLLGAGGMGEVYAGEQPVIGKKVAIKVLKLEVAADKENVRRMLAEARAVNAIRNRSIVDIFNFGTLPDGRPYLVMEYLTGEPLDAALAKRGKFSPIEACELLEEISGALWAAHSAGVVHRDLKPANTFLVTDPTSNTRYVKLLDFGLAKTSAAGTSGPHTQTGMVVGTPDYIAPEQARGATVTGQTDLYSLGVMAFELLTGQLPFTGASVVELMMEHLKRPAPRASTRANGIPPELDDLVLQMMAKEAGERPESADEVRRVLKRIKSVLRDGETKFTAPAARTGKEKALVRGPAVPAGPAPKVAAAPPRSTNAGAKAAAPAPKPAPVDHDTATPKEPVESQGHSDATLPAPEMFTARTALDTAPVRDTPRPTWLVPFVAGVGVLVLGGLGYVFFGGSSAPEPAPPSPDSDAVHVVAVPVEPAKHPEAPKVEPSPVVEPPAPAPAKAAEVPAPAKDKGAKAPVVVAKAPPAATPKKAGPPTREELDATFSRALKNVRTDLSPQLLNSIAGKLREEIRAASSPDERAQALKDIREFQKRFGDPDSTTF